MFLLKVCLPPRGNCCRFLIFPVLYAGKHPPQVRDEGYAALCTHVVDSSPRTQEGCLFHLEEL